MGLKLVFLVVTRAVSLLGLSRREWWWKDAEILMLRHQLAVAEREQPRAHSRLAWPDRAWLALLAGTLRHSRRSVPTYRSANEFARGDRIGVLMIRTPAPASTSSKMVVNLLSRSRIRNLLRHEVACCE